MSRDPRLNPMKGDKIRQHGSTGVITVTERDGDMVSWRHDFKKKASETNRWTVSGWREHVCRSIDVLHVAKESNQ